MHDELLTLDLPTVFIGDLPNQAVDNVRLDDFGGGYAMGKLLAEKGHRRVLHVTGPGHFAEAMARAAGFEQGLADHGSPPIPELRYEGTYLQPSGGEAVDWLVANHRRDMPSAIFFASFMMATGGMARLHDHKIAVPQDIAVSVFGDQPEMRYVRPTLTRVGVPPSTLAHRAVEMLIERLNGVYTGPVRAETIKCTLSEHLSA